MRNRFTRSKRSRLRSSAGLTAFIACIAVALFIVPAAFANTPVSGAVFTTVNPAEDGTGHCLNGGPGADAGLVDCNIYDGKEFVWLSGGPDGNQPALADGTYFFAVLVPGGQGGNDNPNDCTENNLSDTDPCDSSNTGAGDAWTNRVFTVSGGTISYSGGHDFSNNKIRLMGYDDTTSPGGEYILAVCNLADADSSATEPPGVDASDCKYDAFKVKTNDTPPAADLEVSKTAETKYDLKYTWSLTKEADKTIVKQVGGSATFNYTITATHDAGTPQSWIVTGEITVFNPNLFDVSGVDVTDAVDNNGDCTVIDGTGITVPGNGSAVLDYTCTYASSPTPPTGTNTATATWYEGSIKHASGTADFDFANASLNDSIDECVTVVDDNATPNNTADDVTLGQACVSDGASKSFQFSHTYSVPAFDCVSYTNTGKFTTNDTGATGTASATVSVCGPAKTGGLTMGFWQNKNGQAIITGQAKTGVCPSATWLRNYVPFQDLSATATCAQVGMYVTNVIKAANASGAAMNAMLKAQMLATALDVYFSDPALGGNKINAPAPIGGVAIDLTKICKMIDGSGGTATCSGTFQNTSSAFGGASCPTSTVLSLLAYASTQSNVGGSVWYGQVKATQELAKNTFDAINNQVAFKC